MRSKWYGVIWWAHFSRHRNKRSHQNTTWFPLEGRILTLSHSLPLFWRTGIYLFYDWKEVFMSLMAVFPLGLKWSNIETLFPKIALYSVASYVYITNIKPIWSSVLWGKAAWVCERKIIFGSLFAKLEGMCCGLSLKCPPQAHILEHLAPRWWCHSEKLCQLFDTGPSWQT